MSTSATQAPVAPPRERIVVGVDGSESSKQALQWALQQARRTGAALRVVTSWSMPMVAGYVPPPPFDLESGARQIVDEAVAEVAGEDAPVSLEKVVVKGPAAAVLLQASSGADLLVVGSRGRGAFAGMLLGSVSTHCVNHASCPVVVVRGES
jgi:nucleotide-binding universal stress UspA family protein